MDLPNDVILAAVIGAGAAVIGGLIQSIASYFVLIRSLRGEREQLLRDKHIAVGAEFFEAAFHGLAELRMRKDQDHRTVVFLGERLKLVVDEKMAERVNRFTGDFASACLAEVPSDAPSANALQDTLRRLQSDLRRSITGN